MDAAEIRRMDKDPLTAAILSGLFMGLGQGYNGEKRKGIVFILLFSLSLVLTLYLVGFLTTPILWVWGIRDAYLSAKRINQEMR